MAYGDVPVETQNQQCSPEYIRLYQEEQRRSAQDRMLALSYESGNPGIYKPQESNSLAEQIRKVIYEIERMDSKELSRDWCKVSQQLAEMSARVPGITQEIANEWSRDIEDISDRASSQGRHGVVRTKILKFCFRIRSQISVAEKRMDGNSGISAMGLQSQNIKSDTRLTDTRPAQQPSFLGGFAGLLGKKPEG